MTDKLEDVDKPFCPPLIARCSGEDTLLGEEELWSKEEEDRRVGMVVQLQKEREERAPTPPLPPPQPPPSLFTPRELLWNSEGGKSTQNTKESLYLRH